MQQRVLLLLACLAAVSAASVDIALDASTSVHAVPANLWGIFYEEINHAAVGGFYSQLIQNPLFQANTSSPWANVGCASAVLDSSYPLNSVNKAALALSSKAGTSCVLTNPGYYGIAAKPEASYTLSFYALLPASAASQTVTVGLSAADGVTRYAATTVELQATGEWVKYETKVAIEDSVTAVVPDAHFFLALPSSSSAVKVYIQCVLMFPAESWRGLPYIRTDLGEMLAAMNPKFIRFPGGNYVEGNNIQSIMRWKNTVGPVEERPGHQGTWGYWSPDHFGLYEELVFAETLGVEPVWVVNAGMTFNGMVPLSEVQMYIQDALDGIEFANGPADSKWGALRASLGHWAPFNLKYIAIGNEEDLNGYLPDYKLRYPLFYGNISAAYPDITIIANTIQVQSVAPMGLQEIHLYTTPESYFADKHLYDNNDRTAPPIFLSEYAVAGTWSEQNNTKNYYTLRAALGEAVFMTMLERNSDIVKMACYAPLFVNSQNHGWDPDAITYDSYRSYGSPSYWNQVMFGSNPGSKTLSTKFDDKTNELAISATSRHPSTANNSMEVVIKAVNYGAEDLDATFTVTLPAKLASSHRRMHHKSSASAMFGTWSLATAATVTTMTADDQFAANSFDAPENVVPVTEQQTITPTVVDATHVQFTFTFPAYAIQVLVLTLNESA